MSQSYTFCVQCLAAFLALWSLVTWLCTWAVEENHWIGACWWQWCVCYKGHHCMLWITHTMLCWKRNNKMSWMICTYIQLWDCLYILIFHHGSSWNAQKDSQYGQKREKHFPVISCQFRLYFLLKHGLSRTKVPNGFNLGIHNSP